MTPTYWSLRMSDLIRIADFFSNNFSRLFPSPKIAPAATADWTSLLPELINRIAGCFLATGDLDLDYYMDFRAVCTTWRCATHDAKNTTDPRFRPHRWILLHEVFGNDARLLVNTATGRIVRKDLPLLRSYRHVATTVDGLLVLANKEPLHLVHILNPFTGDMTHYTAPMPPILVSSTLVVGSSPTLVLLSDWTRELYMADPSSKYFALYKLSVSYPLVRLAVMCGMYTGSGQELSAAPRAAAMDNIFDLLRSFAIEPSEMFKSDHCFLVEYSASRLLLIVKVQQRMEVFKIDMERCVVEPVKSIGQHAIFLGHPRCLCINADKFESVEADCIYDTEDPQSSMDFYMYDLKNEKQDRVTRHMFDDSPPFTIIQLLYTYTANVPGMELQLAQTGCVIL